MSDWNARFWDKLLTAYGKAPYHPGKWRVVQRLQDRASEAWKSTRVVRRRGVWYRLDLSDYLPRWVFLNCFEVWETRLIDRVVRRGWVAADIGANIGYYTARLARLVGPGGKVYAFEPNACCYENLGCNVALNSFDNVGTFPIAVGNERREVALSCSDARHPSKTHVAMTGEPAADIVRMITLDQFADEHRLDRLDFIKVDIEGCEGLFLAGAGKTLARFRPVVMIELNPSALARFGCSPEQITEQLRKYGYDLFQATWHGLAPLRGTPGQGEYWNVFAFAR